MLTNNDISERLAIILARLGLLNAVILTDECGGETVRVKHTSMYGYSWVYLYHNEIGIIDLNQDGTCKNSKLKWRDFQN